MKITFERNEKSIGGEIRTWAIVGSLAGAGTALGAVLVLALLGGLVVAMAGALAGLVIGTLYGLLRAVSGRAG